MIADEAYEIALSSLRGEERHRQHDARRKQAVCRTQRSGKEMEHEAERDRQNMLNSLSHMVSGRSGSVGRPCSCTNTFTTKRRRV